MRRTAIRRSPTTAARIFPCDPDAAGDIDPSSFAAAICFAACYAYSPSGEGPLCEQARALCARLKGADPRWLARFAVQVWWQRSARGQFAAVFRKPVVLVPVPGSGQSPRGPWVGERLACALERAGLAQAVWPVLRRRTAVRKSAFAPAGERPSVLEHYRSLAIERAWEEGGAQRPARLVLVDDVITRGRTLLAAAARLREAFPGCEIRAFALMRTLGRGETPWRNPDPCEGEVRWLRGDARRSP